MKHLVILATAAVVLSAWSTVLGQPQEINVTSLTVTRNASPGIINFDLRAVNAQQQPYDWYVHDSTAYNGIPQFERCRPCSAPQLFDTYVFENPMSVQVGQTNIVIKLIINAGTSDPAYLGQRTFAQKKNFVLKGSTRLTGKLEIRDLGVMGTPLLAYDNDVDLQGQYALTFSRPARTVAGSLETGFLSVVYTLTDSR